MAALPAYAQILFDGYSVTKESALLRTEMESGPPKQAKVKSRVMVTHKVNFYLDSRANYQAFETWYANDISYGADWFDYPDPISGNTVQARFKNGGYDSSPMSANMDQWKISAQIEMWSE
jgi:hypothetical protein